MTFTTPVPKAVYEFLKDPGEKAPLTGPFASRADEVAAYHARNPLRFAATQTGPRSKACAPNSFRAPC